MADKGQPIYGYFLKLIFLLHFYQNLAVTLSNNCFLWRAKHGSILHILQQHVTYVCLCIVSVKKMGNWKWLSLIEVIVILSYLDYSFNKVCNLVFLGIFMRLSKLCSYSISNIGKSQLSFHVTNWTLLLSLVTVCKISRSSLLEPPKDVLLNRGSETWMAMVKLPTLSHRMAYICGLLEDLNMFTKRNFLSFRAR